MSHVHSRTEPCALPGLLPPCLVVALRVEDPQDGEEQVDDVQVERDGRRNLLLNVVVAHDQLSIDQDVSTEDERSNDAIPKLDLRAVWEEHGHESKQYEHPQGAKQIWYPAREVIFALAGKQTECNKDSKCKDDGLEDDLLFSKGYDDRDGVGFERRESGEEHQVRGI